jgi:hypothetical protein
MTQWQKQQVEEFTGSSFDHFGLTIATPDVSMLLLFVVVISLVIRTISVLILGIV